MTRILVHHYKCMRRVYGSPARCNCNPVPAVAGDLECPSPDGCEWSTAFEATAQGYRGAEAQFRSHLAAEHDGATFLDAKRWHAEDLQVNPELGSNDG